MDPYKYFSDRRPGEQVEMLLRRHWNAMVRHFLLFVVEFSLPLILTFIFFNFGDYVFEKENTVSIIVVLAASIYYLFIWLFFINHWVDYYLDVWIVTNQRILNIEQEGLFSRTISELNLRMVQDATSEVKGKVATILNFGNVYIQTAGEEKRFVFEKIPQPRRVAEQIIDLQQKAVNKAIAEGKMAPPAPPKQNGASSFHQTDNGIKTF